MIFFTHLLLVLVLIKFLALAKTEIVYALAFGVFIDFDHVFKLPMYVKYFVKNKKNVTFKDFWNSPSDAVTVNTRSFVQEPVFLLFVIPFSVLVKSFIPLLFFGLHVFLDYLTFAAKKPFYPFSNYSCRGFVRTSRVYVEGVILLASTFLLVFL
jgi:membrane-bound metal-dependent hydrolase YbcI (DUF457 family)